MGEPTNFKEMYDLLLAESKKQTQLLTSKIESSESRVTSQISKSNQKFEQIEEKQILLERKLRRNNILFFGFKSENSSDLAKDSIAKINSLLTVNIKIIDINNLYKLGKSVNAPIRIEFISYLKKAELFKNPEKLRALNGTGYAIANDLCDEDRKEMKILREHLKKAKEENKEAKIRGQKLEINNKLYTVRELQNSYSETSSSEYEETESSEEEVEQKTKSGTSTQNNQKKRKPKNKSPGGVKTRSHKKKKRHC